LDCFLINIIARLSTRDDYINTHKVNPDLEPGENNKREGHFFGGSRGKGFNPESLSQNR